ncbi:hypothetical protein BMJ34_25575, partial [Sinorhizobium medicae]
SGDLPTEPVTEIAVWTSGSLSGRRMGRRRQRRMKRATVAPAALAIATIMKPATYRHGCS